MSQAPTQASPTRAAALAAVRDRGHATVTDLAVETGLSRPTVEAALAQLKPTGLVRLDTRRVQVGEHGGRPARAYSFRPDRGLVVGLDLSRAEAVVLVSDLSGRVLTSAGRGRPSPSDADPDLAPVADLVREALEGIGQTMADVRAVGLGVGGLVDEKGVLTASPTVRGWRDVNLGEQLTRLLHVPVLVDNDLALAATAEAQLGSLAGAHCGVYALTWHHVSARITIDGEVLRGRHHQAGEVGLLNSFREIQMPPGDMLEAAAVISAELDQLRHDTSHEAGTTALTHLVDAMTPGIAALVLAVDPDVVVLGGQLGSYADLIAPRLARSVGGFASGFALDVQITASTLGPGAVALGALHQAFTMFSNEIYVTSGVPAPKLRLGTHGSTTSTPPRSTT
ncbi:MAG: ROK family protein [Intrasporangium sp.]|uniref:ROK family transcriptional regulator n=1 Tax=Intrasporangium sp. TaxID=1925024 RepID=UPI002649B56D|nr:ROK family protein [Intrasporangium sp.]MDN5796372.1 ROK family protein [Intrasporangium sp.]